MQIEILSFAAWTFLDSMAVSAATTPAAADDSRKERRFTMATPRMANEATRWPRIRPRVANVHQKSNGWNRLLALVSRVTGHAVGGSRQLFELLRAARFTREDVVRGIDQGLGLRVPTRLLTFRWLVFMQGGKQAGELLLLLFRG